MHLVLLIACIIGCELVGLTSSFFTFKPLKTWYKNLKKPSFNPPNGIFGPVWTMLYALMGISFYLVITSPQRSTAAIVVFLLQLFLNFCWSFIFFTLKQLTFAFVEIVLLLCVIGATIYIFWPISHLASLLLIPYFLWVSFATLLTYSIRKLNR